MDTRSVLLFICFLPGLLLTGSPCSGISGLVAVSPCSSYFLSCRHGIESRVNCSHGLIFNPDNSQCDLRENVPSCKDQLFCTRGDGYFGVGCSHVYWLCRDGSAIQQLCPDSLFFNEVTFTCDLKIGVPACGGVSRQIAASSSPSSGSSPTLQSTKSKSFKCDNFNNGKSALSLCNANYIECSKGVLSVGVCPSGTLFDNDRSACVNVNELDYCLHAIPKFKATSPPVESECTNLEDGMYSTGCSRTFFTCTHGTQHVFNCPVDLIYNEALELCDYPDAVQSCHGQEADPVNKETGKTSGPDKGVINAWKVKEVPDADQQREIDCSSHPDGFYSLGCVSEYVSCIGGTGQKYSCGNLVFNSVEGICDYPERCAQTTLNRDTTFPPGPNNLPTVIDCSKNDNGIYSTGCVVSFTSCSEGLSFHGRCPEGLVYNQHAGYCDYVESCAEATAHIKGNDAPGTVHPIPETTAIDCSVREDGFYSNKKCSPEFFACSNGRSQQRRCPDLLLFVDEFGYCDYPSEECDTVFEPKSADQPQKNLKQYGSLVSNKTYECATDGLFEMGCSSTYISCSNGLPTHVTCPNNLVFNPSSKVCDYSCHVGPAHDVPVFDNSVDNVNKPLFDSQKCDKDGPIPGQACLPSFYVCFHGYRVLQNCPSSLVFSDQMQRCEYPELCQALAQPTAGSPTTPQINLDPKASIVYSPTSNQDTNDFSCLHRRDGFYSLGGCYGMYAQCNSGRLSVQNCPNGLVFNAFSLSCEKQCISDQKDAPQVPKAPPTFKSRDICLRGKRFALGQCKGAFLECRNGQQIFKECPTGTTFDIKYGLCIYDAPNCKVNDAVPTVPIYQQQAAQDVPIYQQQAAQDVPIYQQQAAQDVPIYQQQAAPAVPIYQQQAAPAVPIYQQQAAPAVPIYQQQAAQRPATCQVGINYPRGDCMSTYLRCVDGYNFEQLACAQNTRFDPISLGCKAIFLISSCVHHEPRVSTPVQSMPVYSDPVFTGHSHHGFRQRHGHHNRHRSHSGEKWVRDGFQGPHRHGQIISNPFYQGRKYAHGHDHHDHGHHHYHHHKDVAYHHVHPHHRRHSVRLLDSFDGPRLRHRFISNPFFDKHHGKSRSVSVSDVFKRITFPVSDSIYKIFPSSHHGRHHGRHHGKHHGGHHGKHHKKHERHHGKHQQKHKTYQTADYSEIEMAEGSGDDFYKQTADAQRNDADVVDNILDEFANDQNDGIYDDSDRQQEASEEMDRNENLQDWTEPIDEFGEEPFGNVRRKRYATVSPGFDSVPAVCQPGSAYQAVAVGYCQQNFVFCTDDLQQLIAACPVGEAFDSVRKVCSDILSCGTITPSSPQQAEPAVIQPYAPAPVPVSQPQIMQTETEPYAPQVMNTQGQSVGNQRHTSHADQVFQHVYQQQYETEPLDGYSAASSSQPQFVPVQPVAQPNADTIGTPVQSTEDQRHGIQSDHTLLPINQQEHESLGADQKHDVEQSVTQLSPQIVSSDNLYSNHFTQSAADVHPVADQPHTKQEFLTQSYQRNLNVGGQSPKPVLQDTIPLNVVTECATSPDGIFSSGCSSTFVSCVGGISYVSSCPAGLVFDGAILACNYPDLCGHDLPDNSAMDPIFSGQQAVADSNTFIPAPMAHAQQEYVHFDTSSNSRYENYAVQRDNKEASFVDGFGTPHSSVGHEDIFQGSHIGHVAPEHKMDAFGGTIGHEANVIHNKGLGFQNQNNHPAIQRFNTSHSLVADPIALLNVAASPQRVLSQDPVFVHDNVHRIPNDLNFGHFTHANNDDVFHQKHFVPSFNLKPEQIETRTVFSVSTNAPIREKDQSFVHLQDVNQRQAVHKESSKSEFFSPLKDSLSVPDSLSENLTPSATSQIGASESALSCSGRVDGGYFLDCEGGFFVCASGQPHLVKCAGATNFNEATQKCEYVVGECDTISGSIVDPYTPTVIEKRPDEFVMNGDSDKLKTYRPVAASVSELVPIIENKPFLGKDSPRSVSDAQETKPYAPLVVSLDEVVSEIDPDNSKSKASRIEDFDGHKLQSPAQKLPYRPSVTGLPYRPFTTELPYRPSTTELPYRPSVSNNVANTEPAYTDPDVLSEEPLTKTNDYEEDSSSQHLSTDYVVTAEENSTPKLISEITDQDEVIAKVSAYCNEQNVAVGDICASFFYVCSYGAVRKMLCSSGEVFNPVSASCVLISNIAECNIGSDHSVVAPSEDSLRVKPKVIMEEVRAPSNNSILTSTEGPQSDKHMFSASDVTTVSAVVEEATLSALRSENGVPCDSEKIAVFPIAHCHITYAVCESTGFARAANCSPSYLFDHALFKCVPSEECGNSQIKEFLAALDSNSDSLSEVCEHAQSDEMRALGECSRSYAVCGSRPAVERCPKNTIFVQSKRKCIDRKNVKACEPHEILPKTTTATHAATPLRSLNEYTDDAHFCVSKDDGYYRSPKKCTGIVQCFNGELIEHSPCPSGLVFNNILKNCDYPVNIPECSEEMAHSKQEDSCVHGAHMADEKDCSVFYRCVWNRKIKMDCPTNTVFNPKLSVCDYIDAVPQCNSHNLNNIDNIDNLESGNSSTVVDNDLAE